MSSAFDLKDPAFSLPLKPRSGTLVKTRPVYCPGKIYRKNGEEKKQLMAQFQNLVKENRRIQSEIKGLVIHEQNMLSPKNVYKQQDFEEEWNKLRQDYIKLDACTKKARFPNLVGPGKLMHRAAVKEETGSPVTELKETFTACFGPHKKSSKQKARMMQEIWGKIDNFKRRRTLPLL